jgi:hypothetical protein
MFEVAISHKLLQIYHFKIDSLLIDRFKIVGDPHDYAQEAKYRSLSGVGMRNERRFTLI